MHAAEKANEAIKALKYASWLEYETFPESRLRAVLEFQHYILYLTPQERCVASSLQFKLEHSLIEFGTKFPTKFG